MFTRASVINICTVTQTTNVDHRFLVGSHLSLQTTELDSIRIILESFYGVDFRQSEPDNLADAGDFKFTAGF